MSPRPTEIRRLVGRYRLDSELGRGAMGTVWSAYDEVLHRPVAVKEVRLSLVPVSERAIVRERTLREARATAMLSHPNVVTLYDVVEVNAEPYVVMELLPSRSLASYISERGTLSPAETAEIGSAVASALMTAHRAGITHRDVKPGNVLIGTDGQIKLTDFGIARNSAESSMTQTGTVLGSPPYIAPEVAMGRAVGPAADLWGLGATLFACLEGRPPYDAGDPVSTVSAVVHGDVPRPQGTGPVQDVVRGLMVKDPTLRMPLPAVRRRLRPLMADPEGPMLSAPPSPATTEFRLPTAARPGDDDARSGLIPVARGRDGTLVDAHPPGPAPATPPVSPPEAPRTAPIASPRADRAGPPTEGAPVPGVPDDAPGATPAEDSPAVDGAAGAGAAVTAAGGTSTVDAPAEDPAGDERDTDDAVAAAAEDDAPASDGTVDDDASPADAGGAADAGEAAAAPAEAPADEAPGGKLTEGKAPAGKVTDEKAPAGKAADDEAGAPEEAGATPDEAGATPDETAAPENVTATPGTTRTSAGKSRTTTSGAAGTGTTKAGAAGAAPAPVDADPADDDAPDGHAEDASAEGSAEEAPADEAVVGSTSGEDASAEAPAEGDEPSGTAAATAAAVAGTAAAGTGAEAAADAGEAAQPTSDQPASARPASDQPTSDPSASDPSASDPSTSDPTGDPGTAEGAPESDDGDPPRSGTTTSSGRAPTTPSGGTRTSGTSATGTGTPGRGTPSSGMPRPGTPPGGTPSAAETTMVTPRVPLDGGRPRPPGGPTTPGAWPMAGGPGYRRPPPPQQRRPGPPPALAADPGPLPFAPSRTPGPSSADQGRRRIAVIVLVVVLALAGLFGGYVVTRLMAGQPPFSISLAPDGPVVDGEQLVAHSDDNARYSGTGLGFTALVPSTWQQFRLQEPGGDIVVRYVSDDADRELRIDRLVRFYPAQTAADYAQLLADPGRVGADAVRVEPLTEVTPARPGASEPVQQTVYRARTGTTDDRTTWTRLIPSGLDLWVVRLTAPSLAPGGAPLQFATVADSFSPPV